MLARSRRVWAASLVPLRARAISRTCRALGVADGWVTVLVVDRGRDVRVVFFAAAGESDVEVFAVDPGSDEQDRNVGGGALRAVDGAGPAVLDMGRNVVGRQHRGAAAGVVIDEQSAVLGGGQDRVAVAVADVTLADRDAAVVALRADHVPGLKTLVADDELRTVGITGFLGCVLGEGVELVDVVAGAGEHHHLGAVGACVSASARTPARQLGRGRGRCATGPHLRRRR